MAVYTHRGNTAPLVRPSDGRHVNALAHGRHDCAFIVFLPAATSALLVPDQTQFLAGLGFEWNMDGTSASRDETRCRDGVVFEVMVVSDVVSRTVQSWTGQQSVKTTWLE